MMLGRKQSLKGGEQVLADYGPDEVFNESADIEWVNMVRNLTIDKAKKSFNRNNKFVEMGETIDEIVCAD